MGRDPQRSRGEKRSVTPLGEPADKTLSIGTRGISKLQTVYTEDGRLMIWMLLTSFFG